MIDRISIDGTMYAVTPVPEGEQPSGSTVTVDGVTYLIGTAITAPAEMARQAIEKIQVNGVLYDIADVEAVEAEKIRATEAERMLGNFVEKLNEGCVRGNTQNLLNPTFIQDFIIEESDTYCSHNQMDLEAGHSYGLYKVNEANSRLILGAGKGFNIIVISDNYGPLRYTDNSIFNLPADIVNPRAFVTNYKSLSTRIDYSNFMFVDVTDGEPTVFVSYYEPSRVYPNKLGDVFGFVSTYGGGSIAIDTVAKKVVANGRFFINTSFRRATNATIDKTLQSSETSYTIDDTAAISYLVYNVQEGLFYVLKTDSYNELIATKPLIIVGLGALSNHGTKFFSLCEKLIIDGYEYEANSAVRLKKLEDALESLEEVAIKKSSERTENLFNYKDKTHQGEIMSDGGTWVPNTAFTTVVIPLEAGKSYAKYESAGVPSTWGNVYCRVFDGDTFLFKDNQNPTITISVDVTNPIGYFGYYNEQEGYNPELFMVLPEGVSGDNQIPYMEYTVTDEAFNSAIDGKIEKARLKKFAERPAEGYENFVVDVDCNIANNTSITNGNQDSKNIKKDRCVLTLPVSYTSNGKPTRLVICGHGTGYKYTAATTSPNAGMNIPLLLGEGYALLGCNGTPGELNGLDTGHNCAPECYRSILAAYRYVIDKYNICTDGVFTVGYSMGTYMTGQIALFKDIPVLAQVFYAFSGEIWKAQYSLKATVRQRMCEKFGFTGTAPTFTSLNPPSADEQNYIKTNIDKWSGYNLLIAGLTNKAILSTYDTWVASNVIESTDEAEIYNDAIVVGRPPCKFFTCDDDTTAPRRWSEYMVKMIRNGGGYAELRHYPSGGHDTPYQGTYINYTTKYGGDVRISGASYEGLLFLQRFG